MLAAVAMKTFCAVAQSLNLDLLLLMSTNI